MEHPPLRIAYLTAGAAGMYCGSCLHDNTLAAALVRLGVDIQLIPTYTPIRTDEDDVSLDRVFFGGINVYLQQRLGLFRWLPPVLDRVLDRPWLLRRATARSTAIDPKVLGDLAVSMLRGEHGHQRKEVRRLGRFLASELKPNLVVLTNMLIGGCIPELKRTLGVPVLGTPEYFLALDAGYHGDHAAWGETSLMLYLDPETVELRILHQTLETKLERVGAHPGHIADLEAEREDARPRSLRRFRG